MSPPSCAPLHQVPQLLGDAVIMDGMSGKHRPSSLSVHKPSFWQSGWG